MSSSVKYIIRYRAMGDVLWIEPVIEALAEKNKKVIVISEYNELFNNYPLKNVVFKDKLSLPEKIFYKLGALFTSRPSLVKLNWAYEKDPETHLLLAYYKKAQTSGPLRYPRLYLNNEESKRPVSSKYVVLNLEQFPQFASYRNVSGINWEMVCNYLEEIGFKVIQVGKIENKIAGVQYKKTTIRELIALIKHATFFIGQDSGPSHIAQCLGVPSLVFFGSVNPWYRHVKHQFKGYILQQACEYAGCYHVQAMGQQTCLLNKDEVMPKCTIHTTDHVMENIEKLIEQYQL